MIICSSCVCNKYKEHLKKCVVADSYLIQFPLSLLGNTLFSYKETGNWCAEIVY